MVQAPVRRQQQSDYSDSRLTWRVEYISSMMVVKEREDSCSRK